MQEACVATGRGGVWHAAIASLTLSGKQGTKTDGRRYRFGSAPGRGLTNRASGCVLELVVCRVRFARVSCPWLRLRWDTQVSKQWRREA